MHLISFYIKHVPSLDSSALQLQCVTLPKVAKCDLEIKQDFSWNWSSPVLKAPKWVAKRCSPELSLGQSRGRGSSYQHQSNLHSNVLLSWTKEPHHPNQSAAVHWMTSHSHSLSEEATLPSIKSHQADNVNRKLSKLLNCVVIYSLPLQTNI